jgi:hypothetical protein
VPDKHLAATLFGIVGGNAEHPSKGHRSDHQTFRISYLRSATTKVIRSKKALKIRH